MRKMDSFGDGKHVDWLALNRAAWDRAVSEQSRWTRPVGSEEIGAARRGRWQIVLTPGRPVPSSWFPPLAGCRVLCLAGGGGQQGPILAAAGAQVTVFDNSPAQLAQDERTVETFGLSLDTILGDMRDLSAIETETFDLIVHPCSNLFVPDVRPVWQEAFRVLRPGGQLLAGFVNPLFFLFDQELAAQGRLEVRHALPYSDLTSLTPSERASYIEAGEALEFGHTLTDQIGGQLDAGFVLQGFYEDRWEGQPPAEYTDTYIATRAIKPADQI